MIRLNGSKTAPGGPITGLPGFSGSGIPFRAELREHRRFGDGRGSGALRQAGLFSFVFYIIPF